MASRLSPGLVKKLVDTGSVRSLLNNGKILVFPGAQRATPDLAAGVTPLLTIGFMLPPVQAAIAGLGTGGGLAAATYYYVVSALNAAGETLKSNEQSYVATGTTSSVTVSWAAVPGATSYRIYRGTAPATETVYYTALGTATSFLDTGAANTGGTPAVANTTGITFNADGSGGILSQTTGTDWLGTIAAAGTAGWFCVCESTDDGISASGTAARWDGAVATSGAEMNLASLTFSLGAPFTVTDAQFTFPGA